MAARGRFTLRGFRDSIKSHSDPALCEPSSCDGVGPEFLRPDGEVRDDETYICLSSHRPYQCIEEESNAFATFIGDQTYQEK